MRFATVVFSLALFAPVVVDAQRPVVDSLRSRPDGAEQWIPARFRSADAPYESPWAYGEIRLATQDSFDLKTSTSMLHLRGSGPWRIDVEEATAHGRRAHALVGSIIGSAAASVIWIGALAECASRDPHPDGPGCGVGIIFLPGIAFGGAALGGIVGALRPVTRWVRIAPEP